MKQINSLTAISPIDGRYRKECEELSNYFSEFAYLKYRLQTEIKYLNAISKIGVVRKINSNEQEVLNKIINEFNIEEAEKIKQIEEKTRHDVKAIEYYIKNRLEKTSLSDLSEFIHFGLTSEDINNIAQRLMLKDSLGNVLLKYINNLNAELLIYAKKYKHQPMLARTHGQPAVPTTLGKEFLVFYQRLNNEIKILKQTKLRAKLNGAVGNYNALYFAFPKLNWIKFSKDFVSSFGLDLNQTTTQIAPYEDIIYFFQTIQRINNIILDFNQDMWRYISDGWFIQENKKGEIGSSTMPQKINPILFENSEGNIIVANSMIEGFTNKLSISRLQRDLSGSTISRNFGVVLAYCLISYQNTLEGFKRIKPNKEKIEKDLNEDWSILSEAVQIYLKKEGVKNGYEIVKNLTRGQRLDQNSFLNLINKLPLDKGQKDELKKITPLNYVGMRFD